MKEHEALIRDVRETVVPYGSAAFWWLGQLGFLIKLGETVLSVDAYLDANNPARLRKPMLTTDEFGAIDVVLGTHDHEDHIDRPCWQRIAKANPQMPFVLPKAHVESISRDLGIAPSRLFGLTDGTSCTIKDVKITGVPAAHELLEYDAAGNSLHMGYIFEGNGVRLYHTGDSCIYEDMVRKVRAFGPLDILFVPINGRDAARLRSGCIGNMTFQEAVDLTGALEPALAVPAHYDMFPNNLANVFDYSDYLEAKYPCRKCWVGPHGEAIMYHKVP